MGSMKALRLVWIRIENCLMSTLSLSDTAIRRRIWRGPVVLAEWVEGRGFVELNNPY